MYIVGLGPPNAYIFNYSYFIVWVFLIKSAVLMAMEKLFQLKILALKYCPKLLEIIHSSRRIGTSENNGIF